MKYLDVFRILDKLSLAMEVGVPNVLHSIGAKSPLALGPTIEALSLSKTQKDIRTLIQRHQANNMLRTLDAAQNMPLEPQFGGENNYTWGFFSLRNTTADEVRNPLYEFELEARKSMQLKKGGNQVKSRLCGALQELVDNILDHSSAPQTGIVGFVGTSSMFELSVGDAGIGMLASMRSNPTFSYLMDSGSAMEAGLKDGNSRYGMVDRGYGFGTLFRALNTLNATLRFRSGDYALEVSGKSPSLRDARISQKATLRGFVVSLALDL